VIGRDMATVPVVTSSVSAMVSVAAGGVRDSVLGRTARGINATAGYALDTFLEVPSTLLSNIRGYQYRNFARIGGASVLTPQQVLVMRTSSDARLQTAIRDSAGALQKLVTIADALEEMPYFDEGGVTLRICLPVVSAMKRPGFTYRSGRREFGATAVDPLPTVPECPEPCSDDESEESDSSGEELLYQKGCALPSARDSCLSEHALIKLGEELLDRAVDLDPFMIGNPDGPTPRCPLCSGAEQLVEGITYLLTPFSKGAGKAKKGVCWSVVSARSVVASGASSVLNAANPVGIHNLCVVDLEIPTTVHNACLQAAGAHTIETKPAKNILIKRPLRKLAKVVTESESNFAYLEAVTTLVTMAALMDVGSSGASHCSVVSYTKKQETHVDFFATTDLADSYDAVKDAKEAAGHLHDGIVACVPAPEVKGSISKVMKMYETPLLEEYAMVPKPQVMGAVVSGVDLFGKSSPNDHKDPINYIGAVCRHLGDKEHTVNEGTEFEYTIKLDHSKKSHMSKAMTRVWEDMLEDHRDLFKQFILDGKKFEYDFLEDGKPSAYTHERYTAWLEEQMLDEQFFLQDTALNRLLTNTKGPDVLMQQLRATGNLKKGEDSSRARAVITPGVAGNEGLHQARTSPMVKALEAFHAALFNHGNLKGCTEETKRIKFAEFLQSIPKGGIVFGTDKSSNDAFFRESVWSMCVKYLAMANEVFAEQVVTRAYVYSPEEGLASPAFPEGTLDLKYWVVKLTPLMAFLLSGIGPTSFLNRLQSIAEIGTFVLTVYGEEGYTKWRFAETHGQASTHPAWDKHPAPHIAEVVDWVPMTSIMTKDGKPADEKLKDEDVFNYARAVCEGDDKAHGCLPPSGPEWTGLSTTSTVQKMTSALSKSSGFIHEAAPPTNEWDMRGKNSVFEMLSAWVGFPFPSPPAHEVVVIVPKPDKALKKAAMTTISQQLTLTKDDDNNVTGVVHNATYLSLAATKHYSLAIVNRESLGVRGFFRSHGDYFFDLLEKLVGVQSAYSHKTEYGPRDPEARGIAEAANTTFQALGVMRDAAHDAILRSSPERCMRVCIVAWKSALPELEKVPRERLTASLLAFDNITMSTPIEEGHIDDPVGYWEHLDIGCLLSPMVSMATRNLQKLKKVFGDTKITADSEATVALARNIARPSTQTTGSKVSGTDHADATKVGKGARKGAVTGADKAHPQPSKEKGKGKGKDSKFGTGKTSTRVSGHTWFPGGAKGGKGGKASRRP